MENLEQYINRTRGFMMDSLRWAGPIDTNLSLLKKVNGDGRFCPFYGDTIIFDINEQARNMVKEIQKTLHQRCPYMLAEEMDSAAYHMTLHDLSNGANLSELVTQMEQNRLKSEIILGEMKKSGNVSVRVKTVSVFNMVNTSVVLGLAPADDTSCHFLMDSYEKFQSVVCLNYPLTLHITVAYFKPGNYSDGQRQELRRIFDEFRKMGEREFSLGTDDLYYQRFNHMNHYERV